MTLVWQTRDDVTLQEHFRVVPPYDWTPTKLHACNLSSIYINITHSQELEAYLFVIPVIGFMYYMDEKINHISLLTGPSFANKYDQKPCLRIFHCEYCAGEKKPSNKEHKNSVGLHVNPRLKWKLEIGRNWICFFNIRRSWENTQSYYLDV